MKGGSVSGHFGSELYAWGLGNSQTDSLANRQSHCHTVGLDRAMSMGVHAAHHSKSEAVANHGQGCLPILLQSVM